MRIISGGQTGADKAALDAAIFLGLDYAGTIPHGRLTENGPLDPRYDRMVELERGGYWVRTVKNVADADATLVFTLGPMGPGTALTIRTALRLRKLWLHVPLRRDDEAEAIARVVAWLLKARPRVLNVAGSRESTSPGIHWKVYVVMVAALAIYTRLIHLRAGGGRRGASARGGG